MKITFNYTTFLSYGALMPHLQYLDNYLSDILEEKNFESSLDEMEFIFAYPSREKRNFKFKDPYEEKWWEWYDSLPRMTFKNKRKTLVLTLPSPGLSKTKGKTDVELCRAVIDIISGSSLTIRTKTEKSTTFNVDLFCDILEHVQATITEESFKQMKSFYKEMYRQATIKRSLEDRENRRIMCGEYTTAIRDIRFYYHISGWENKIFFPYDNELCEEILIRLRKEKFKCPGYSHLYIMVSDTWKNALQHALRIEKWFVYGLAVLDKPEEYLNATEKDKKRYVFDLIKEGLMDIARIDGLDEGLLRKVLEEVEETYIV